MSFFCRRCGGVVVIAGIAGLAIGLSLSYTWLIFASAFVSLVGGFIGCMSVPTISGLMKDHLYQDWPVWVLISLFAGMLCVSRALSLPVTVAFVVGVIALRHLIGLLTFSASMCGYWLEPKYLAWHARRQKSA